MAAAPLIGLWAAAVALAPGWAPRIALAAPALAIPFCRAVLARPSRWVTLFLLAALLLPPLPIALGDSGPHVALAIAALGLAAGLWRAGEWRAPMSPYDLFLSAYALVLLASIAPALLLSGGAIGALSLARVGLFSISIYVFFYTACGPGAAARDESPGVARWLFRAGVAAGIFACIDFYFQLPAPAGFGPQFVWLKSGVYRRAQGVFYEASTLGNVCVFFLVMAAVSLTRRKQESPVSRLELAAGSACLFAALLASFSRASVVNLAVACSVLVWLNRRALRLARLAVALMIALAAGITFLYVAMPRIVEFYFRRLSGTLEAAESGAVLSGRLENWSHLLGFLAEHPEHALLGVGYKTLAYSDVAGRAVIADNAYLSALVETGLVGLAAMLLFNFAILRSGFHAARSPDARISFFGTWIACFWTGEMVQMLSGDLLTYWRVLPVYLWVLANARK